MKNYTLTKEALIRVAKTFIQALIAFLVVALPTVDFTQDKSALKAALLGVSCLGGSSRLVRCYEH